MSRIFVSYRREDSEGETGRIADRLIARFGADAVFYDRESLRDGDRWRHRIDAALADCELMLLVIGPKWESVTGADGRRRLDDPDDIAAYEVGAALQRGVRLTPLLVRRTDLPAATELPPALRPLRDSQARLLHADAFNPLLNALIDGIEGPSPPRRRGLMAAGAATVVVAAVGVAGWLARTAPPAEVAPTAAAAEPISGELHLRVKLADDPDADPGEQGVLMALIDPIASKMELPPPVAGGSAQRLDFVLERTLLPRAGERYEADLTRRVQSARRTLPARTTLCLRRTPAAPPSGLAAIAECDEGQRCKAAADNPGHFAVSCSDAPLPQAPAGTARKVSVLLPGLAGDSSWPWLPAAQAQPVLPRPAAPPATAASAAATATAPDAIWAIPSIETLHRRQQAGRAGAYVEVRLASPPLPDLQAAQRLWLEIVVNGHPAWIDGLPPQATTFPFDAAQGVQLQFGLENLDFSGAHMGSEKIELKLRFLDGKKVLREWQSQLNYVALRPKDEPKVVGDAALGIAWSAAYYPGRSQDRWQVFLQSPPLPQHLESAKRRFDDAGHAAQLDGATLPLVAVIRPPWRDNPNWGLIVGTRQSNGQIRFTFDDSQAAQLCRVLGKLAADPRSGVRKDAFRRSTDDRLQTRACSPARY